MGTPTVPRKASNIPTMQVAGGAVTGPRAPPPALAPRPSMRYHRYHRRDRFPRPASPAMKPPAPHVFPRGPQPALCGVRCSHTQTRTPVSP